MRDLNLSELGEVFRERRIELGLKQTDLEDDYISSSTISNLEKGTAKVSVRKIKHLCNKLKLNYEDIPMYIEERRRQKEKNLKKLSLRLKTIENDIYCVNPSSGLRSLRELSLESSNPYYALSCYLKGKCYYKMGNWGKAKRYYKECLGIIKKGKCPKEMNLEAACRYGLGQIYFRENDLAKALEEAHQGLSVFDPNGERKHLRFHLLIAKVIYLEKMDRNTEAIVTLERDMWSHLDEIDSEVQLNMYELHSTLLNKEGMYEEAISYAEKGIEIARRVKNFDRCFELWTTLGSSYKKINELDLAKMCFETALRFRKNVRPSLAAYNYTELGILLWKEGKRKEAIEYLQKAVEFSKKAGDDFRHFEALRALGKCFEEIGKQEEAVSYMETAYEIARGNMLLPQEREVIAPLIRYYADKDMFRHRKYSDRLIEITLQLSQRRGENMAHTRKLAGDPPDE